MPFTFYQIAAYFLIYSCLGWCVEVAYAAVTTGKLVNRGFLNGPVCPIYGFGMLALLFLLRPVLDNNLLLFAGGMLIPSLIELAGGWVLYRLYHTRWWDYTDRPFNLGGYICLEFSLYWGLGAVFVMKLVHPTVAALVDFVPVTPGWVLIGALYLVYAADLVATTIAAAGLAAELEALEKIADGIHAVSDAMTGLIGSTAMDADQKLDESRLQLKLAGAELRTAGARLSVHEMRQMTRAARAKAEEAIQAARMALPSGAEQQQRLARLAAELEARAEEMQAQLQAQLQRRGPFSPGRLLNAFPRLRHGSRRLSLDALRRQLQGGRGPGSREDRDK